MACTCFYFQLSLLLFYIVPTTISIIVTDPPPSSNDYKYSYDIEDPSTGDSKSQREVRQGDVVRGSYSVVDPDGKKRTVEYTADAEHGFKAIVRDEPAEAPIVSTPTSIIRKQEPYVQKYQPVYSPIRHTPEVIHQPVEHYEKNYVDDQNYYFVPENYIKPDSPAFGHGQYFLPAGH